MTESESFELLGVVLVRKVIGLWSEYNVTIVAKIQCLNFCNDLIAAYIYIYIYIYIYTLLYVTQHYLK